MDESEILSEAHRHVLRRSAWAVSVAFSLLGRSALAVEATPAPIDTTRIVSVGGAVTEILFALGMGSSVVAVDGSSVFPATATSLPQIGYQRALSAEGILAQQPTVVIATEEAGPPPVLAQLRSAGVPVVTIPAEASLAAVRAKIERLAELVKAEAAGAKLLSQLDGALAQARTRTAAVGEPLRVLFVYARGAGTLNVSGRGTSADLLIDLAGARNAVTEFEGFRPLTSEAVVAAAPDVILLTTRGLESVGGSDGALRFPGVALTPAGRARRILALDDLLLLGLGPRTGAAALELAALLYAAPGSAKAGVAGDGR